MTARSGRSRRRHRKVSAPDRPEDPEALSYQWERFHLISREFPGPFRRHWEESGSLKDNVPLDVDWNHYFDADLMGRLALLTVRRHTVLVGYVFVFNFPNPHHVSTPWAHVDKIWLDPAYRRGFAGVKMIRHTIQYMDTLGAKMITCGIPLHQERIGRILQRYKFQPVETVFARVV